MVVAKQYTLGHGVRGVLNDILVLIHARQTCSHPWLCRVSGFLDV
jgi:hypothetical protein